jgi:hypothetical protein
MGMQKERDRWCAHSSTYINKTIDDKEPNLSFLERNTRNLLAGKVLNGNGLFLLLDQNQKPKIDGNWNLNGGNGGIWMGFFGEMPFHWKLDGGDECDLLSPSLNGVKAKKGRKKRNGIGGKNENGKGRNKEIMMAYNKIWMENWKHFRKWNLTWRKSNNLLLKWTFWTCLLAKMRTKLAKEKW